MFEPLPGLANRVVSGHLEWSEILYDLRETPINVFNVAVLSNVFDIGN
jgi:hypothetical protein